MQAAKILSFAMFIFLSGFCIGCDEGDTVILTASGNQPPVVSAIPDQAATESSPFNFDIAPYITDDYDGTTDLTFMAISGAGTFSDSTYTNTFITIGTTQVHFLVMDTEGLGTPGTFDVSVSAAVNNPPVISYIPTGTVALGNTFILDTGPYVSDDRDEDSELLFQVTSGGGAFNGSLYINAFTTPSPSPFPEVYTIDIMVTDTAGATAARSFGVTVYPPPVADFRLEENNGSFFAYSDYLGATTTIFKFINTNFSGVNYRAWDFDSDGTIDSTEASPEFQFTGNGTYTVTLWVGGLGGTAVCKKEIGVGRVYVWDQTGLDDLGYGTSWEHPFKSIKKAISAVHDECTILVGPDYYTGPDNRDLHISNKSFILKSLNGSDSVIIDLEGLGPGLSIAGSLASDCIIDGFTIYRSFGGPEISISNCSPAVTNCIVYGSGNNVGISCANSESVITDCRIHSNNKGVLINSGSNILMDNCMIYLNVGLGGISCSASSSLKLVNSIVVGNEASNGSGGGIMCSSSTLTILNSTIAGNSAPDSLGYGGGIYCSLSTLTMTDSIVWGNSAGNTGDGIYLFSTTDSISFSCIQDGWPDNISTDPEFVTGTGPYPINQYYLSQVASGQGSDSPCLNTGGDTAANLGLNGKTTRTDGVTDSGTVDMGYHFDP